MKIIVCLDDRDGMLFGGRRQSMDGALRQRVIAMSAESCLWMNGYSAKQFKEAAGHIRVDENFPEKAGPGEYCFVENTPLEPMAERAEAVIVYRWNRAYPGDVKFPASLFQDRWQLVQSTEFPGSSHQVITEEIYLL